MGGGRRPWPPLEWTGNRTTVRSLENVTDSCPLSKNGIRPRTRKEDECRSRRGTGRTLPAFGRPAQPRADPESGHRGTDALRGRPPLSGIAKKAGVGQGTFYRNFPHREALVLEVYRYEMQQVADAAPELLATREPERAPA